MGYPFEDLDDSQFERLIVHICRRLFGIGVESFATGPDGGRDAKFLATAEQFPSRAEPWTGTTIIQAKHTIAINAHCADPDFSGSSDSSVLSKEIPRIKNLVTNGGLDNYVIFTNRRLGAVLNEKLSTQIRAGAGVQGGVRLAGVEFIEDMMGEFPKVISLAGIDPVDGPLRVSSKDLAEVILALRDALNGPLSATPQRPVDRVSYAKKNKLNGMTVEFAKELQKRFQVYTRQIESFLAHPANAESRERYEAAVEDFQLKILAKRQDRQPFDDVYNHLIEVLRKQDAVLARNVRLTRAVVFYMYWHCDIGESDDAVAE